MTRLSFVLIYLNAVPIRVKALRCEKSTSLARLHLLSRCNGFIEKWLHLTLIIINIPVDLSLHLLSSEDQIDQEIRDLFAALAVYWPREKVRHFKGCGTTADRTNNATERIIGLDYKIRAKTMRCFKDWEKTLGHCYLSEFIRGQDGLCDLHKVV